MKKYKIGVNENLTSIFTYINSNPNYIVWSELIQYCIDYDLYIEFYMNFNVIEALLNEHNRIVVAKKKQL